MHLEFEKVGLVGKPDHDATDITINKLQQFLSDCGCQVFVDDKNAKQSNCDDIESNNLDKLGELCDLIIVVGGDGNMLGAARTLSHYNVPVLGVNRGNLGFLTDLRPESFERPLQQVLQGDYLIEERFLLEVSITDNDGKHFHSSAVNEAVFHSGKVAHMMEFEVYINDDFMFSQRADGLIVCTPTGSTAYSLSGGGPILTPNLEVLCLQPMYPHTLSNRPIVVDANSEIRLVMSKINGSAAVTCDGHNTLPFANANGAIIRKQKNKLKLVHPKDYSYYNVIRRKLNWGSKLY